MPVVIGIDPGIASLGIAVVDTSPRKVIGLHVCETKRRMGVIDTRDKMRRLVEVHKFLVKVFRAHPPAEVFMEDLIGSRYARSAALVNLFLGAFSLTYDESEFWLKIIPPYEAKFQVADKKRASKEEMIQSVETSFGIKIKDYIKKKSQREHAADALAVIIAGMKLEERW